MRKTYFSNRVYKKDNFSPSQVYFISNAMVEFNRAKHKACKLFLTEKNYKVDHDPSVHMQIKKLFGFNDYWTNSAVKEAKAQISSQEELRKIYAAGVENQIKTKKDRVKELNSKIKRLEELLALIIKGKFKTWRGSYIVKRKSGIIGVDSRNKSLVFFNAYDFEHQYLCPEIKRLKNRVKLISFSITRLEKKLKKLQSDFIKGCVFGTKDLFKKQFTVKKYQNDHETWLKEWYSARYSSLIISGRTDAKYGNFVFKYDVKTNILAFDLPNITADPEDNIADDLPNKITISVPVVFKYGQKEVGDALIFQNERRKPIAWSIEDHGDYYIFKITVDIPNNPYVNYCKDNGVVGIDMNFDHAALTEINRHGSLIDWLNINYNLEGKTSDQIIKILEKAAIDIIDFAKEKKKPIIIEDLDTTDSKFKLQYGSKKRNKKISLFAYRILTNAIYARADKEGVAVFKVKPNFTSIMGKLKYMAQKGISIHTAAALVIARRGMRFKEIVPPVLSVFLPEKIRRRHHWSQWNYLQRQVKGVKVHYLYQLSKKFKGSEDTVGLKKVLESSKILPQAG